MECKKEKIRSLCLPTRICNEASVEGEVILPDYCPNIMRLVRTQARTYVVSKTSRGDKFAIEGYVEFTVLYTAEEDGKLKSVMHSLPFSHSFDITVKDTTFIYLTINISSVSARALSPQKLWIRAVFEPCLLVADENESEILSSDAPSGICIRREGPINGSCVVCTGQKPVKVSDEISLAPKKCDKILGYDVSFIPTDKKMLTGKMIAKADMVLKILCSDAESGIPFNIEKTVPVSQAVDITGADEETLCDVSYSLRDCKFELLEQSNGSSDIAYEAEVCAEVRGLKNIPFYYCSDAFSQTETVKTIQSDVQSASVIPASYTSSVRMTIQTGEYDKIYSVNVNPIVRTQTLDAEYCGLNVEGDFICSIVMCDADGEICCTEKSIPFNFSVPTPGCRGDAVAAASVSIKNFAFVENDAQSIEVRIDYCYEGLIFCGGNCQMLCDIQSTGARQATDKGQIVIYFAQKDEDIWTIAKNYGVNPDVLCSTNGISDGIRENKTLLI